MFKNFSIKFFLKLQNIKMDLNCENYKLKYGIIKLLDNNIDINPSYLDMSLEDLNKQLEIKTASFNDITHAQYQRIYDMNSFPKLRIDEKTIINYKLLKNNIELEKMNELIRKQTEEILYLQNELESSNLSKSPSSLVDYENDRNSISSKSPSTYQPYNYSGKLSNFPNQHFSNEDYDEEDRELQNAISKSQQESNRIIDDPFNKLDEIRKKSEDRYKHLEHRPEEATDEILDELYDLLVERNFNKIKELFSSSKIPLIVIQWIRNLNYGGSSFKQMLVSKSINIHKCLRDE